jgi:Rrf2 family protein
MDLPEALSIQIISHLAHENLINTYPGRNGGIQLALSPDEITLLDVIRVMEGPVVLSECLEDDHDCRLSPTCPVQNQWSTLQDMVENHLASITFWELVKSVHPQKVVDVQ